MAGFYTKHHMRAVLQRVARASVEIDGQAVASIPQGLLIFLGISKMDSQLDAGYLAEKIAHLRIFSDERGKMNRSVTDIGGAVLVVSQFTLYGDCRKGRRPNFDSAAVPGQALGIYDYFVQQLASYGFPVKTGVFQASMQVSLVNDGPVTFLVESKQI